MKLDGGTLFDCNFTARVLTLEEGESLKCRVVRKNEAGATASAPSKNSTSTRRWSSSFRVSCTTTKASSAITDLSVGDEIRTTVLGCRFHAQRDAQKTSLCGTNRPPPRVKR